MLNTRAILLSLTGLFFLASTAANARGGNRKVMQSAKMVESGIYYLIDAHTSKGFRKRANMRRAYYKLKTASFIMENAAVSNKAINAVKVAVEKLNDRSLSKSERIAFALECASVAVADILADVKRKRLAVKKIIYIALELNEACLFEALNVLLTSADDVLHGIRNRTVKDAIETTLEKINDRYLSEKEKYDFALDCLNAALDAL